MTGRRISLALCWFALAVAPAAARTTLVCRVTARVPFSAAHGPGADSTRVFVQTALLLEERRSGNPAVNQWTVIVDSPEQLVAVDPARSRTLVVYRPGGAFAESGVQVQWRGYCATNDLP